MLTLLLYSGGSAVVVIAPQGAGKSRRKRKYIILPPEQEIAPGRPYVPQPRPPRVRSPVSRPSPTPEFDETIMLLLELEEEWD